MGRSKERSKPVGELTLEELKSERHRCETLAAVYGNKISAKLLRRRLLEIDRRLAELER
jgi:hypothetical protein